jgi:hypothetical protein
MDKIKKTTCNSWIRILRTWVQQYWSCMNNSYRASQGTISIFRQLSRSLWISVYCMCCSKCMRNLCCTKCMWDYHYVLVCGICVVLNICGTTVMHYFSLLVISILVCTYLCNVPPALLVLKI